MRCHCTVDDDDIMMTTNTDNYDGAGDKNIWPTISLPAATESHAPLASSPSSSNSGLVQLQLLLHLALIATINCDALLATGDLVVVWLQLKYILVVIEVSHCWAGLFTCWVTRQELFWLN